MTQSNELFEQEWTTLSSLWARVKAAQGGLTSPPPPGQPAPLSQDEIGRIDALLQSRPTGADWALLNRAEQAVGACLTPSMVVAEYEILLDIARARKLSVTTYEAQLSVVQKTPATEDERVRQVSTYLALLHVLQSDFVDTRFRRKLRRQTAVRLLGFGAVIVVLAGVVLLSAIGGYFYSLEVQSRIIETVSRLSMVAAFGIMGAYFSRATSFQTKIAEFSFADVINVYEWKVLVLRLLYGMIGAIIFYYLLRSGLIGGEAFPALHVEKDATLAKTAANALKAAADTAKATAEAANNADLVKKAAAAGEAAKTAIDASKVSGSGVPDPMGNLAKLLVWSFLAGFSERLVPDALERTEARMKKTE